MSLLSLRGYAKHRQVTLRAVQKAIETGRIVTVQDGKGTLRIDSEDADRRWDTLTDPAKQRPAAPPVDPSVQLAPPDIPIAPAAIPAAAPKESLTNAQGQPDYYKAKAQAEMYKAKSAELDYLERAGLLIETDQVLASWQKIITTAKTKLLAVPSKVRARIPHLTVADIATIEEEIRESLLELANDGTDQKETAE